MTTVVGALVVVAYNLLLWWLPTERWGYAPSHFLAFVLAATGAYFAATAVAPQWTLWGLLGTFMTWRMARLKPEREQGIPWNGFVLSVLFVSFLVFTYLRQS